MVLMYIGLGYITVLLLIFYLQRENRIREAGRRTETIAPGESANNVKDKVFTSDQEAVSSAWPSFCLLCDLYLLTRVFGGVLREFCWETCTLASDIGCKTI